MIKVKDYFKKFWEWLRKLFQKEDKTKLEEKEPEETPPEEPEEVEPEEVEAEEVQEDDEAKKVTQIDNSNELLSSSFSEKGKRGFIRIYSVKSFNRVVHEHFHSIDELVSCLYGRNKNSIMRERNSSVEGDSSFTGTSGYREAVDLLRNGYAKILPDIKSGVEKNLGKLKELFVGTKSKPMTSVVGCSPNVPKYLMGLPQSMDDRSREIQKVKTIDIIYSPEGPWYINRDTFIRGGIAMLSTIQLLENSGISISLSCIVYTGYKKNEAITGTVHLKDYKDRLDLKKLCFPIAHPSMLRRIGFRFLETVPEITEPEFARNYGMSPSHDMLVEMLKIRPNVVVLSLPLISDTLKYDVKRIIAYIKENAKR